MKIETTGRFYSTIPNEKIAIDIKGPMKIHNFRFKTPEHVKTIYIIVIVDTTSRFTRCEFVYKTKIEQITKAIRKWIQEIGRPKYVLSDQGRQFISNKFKLFCNENELKHITTTPYNFECNGIVERTNKTIGEILRLTRGKERKFIQNALHVRLNETVNTKTKRKPAEDIKKEVLPPEWEGIKENTIALSPKIEEGGVHIQIQFSSG